jgi:hypothetical protein
MPSKIPTWQHFFVRFGAKNFFGGEYKIYGNPNFPNLIQTPQFVNYRLEGSLSSGRFRGPNGGSVKRPSLKTEGF